MCVCVCTHFGVSTRLCLWSTAWQQLQPSTTAAAVAAGMSSRILAWAFSLFDPDCILIFPQSFSPLLHWADNSTEGNQVKALRVNETVQWRPRIKSPVSQLEREKEMSLLFWLDTCLSTVIALTAEGFFWIFFCHSNFLTTVCVCYYLLGQS